MAPVHSTTKGMGGLAMALAQSRGLFDYDERVSTYWPEFAQLGFYESELLRRVDRRHRTLGRFFQQEIATPLGLEFYIRLPEEIPRTARSAIAASRPRRAGGRSWPSR